MTKSELLARELCRMHIMTRKVGSYVNAFIFSNEQSSDIEMFVDEFWHMFEDDAEEILIRLEKI